MARLFIIGNGYDIAHKTKKNKEYFRTDYLAFRDWLINEIIKKRNQNFSIETFDMRRLFVENKVSWIPLEWFAHNVVGLDEEESKKIGENEQNNAEYTFAICIIWIINKMENGMLATKDHPLWCNFEETLGDIEKELLNLISETQINKLELFGVDVVERVFDTLKVIWDKWIKSIDVTSNLEKNEYDINEIGTIREDDLFLTFNYTETIEFLFNCDDKVYHIHGFRKNSNDELIVGHGNIKFSTYDPRKYNDLIAEETAEKIESKLYKDVDNIIENNSFIFDCINNNFKNEKENQIYCVGFSLSNADIKYMIKIKNIVDLSKVKVLLCNHDKENDIKANTDDCLRNKKKILENLGFTVDYSIY